MAKGDDTVLKKRNKAIRKRARRAGADTPEAVKGHEAHRRRRKLGTRRVCEAMCYTLPTPEDPFNEKGTRKKKRQNADRAATSLVKGPTATKRKRDEEGRELPDDGARSKKRRKVEDAIRELQSFVQANVETTRENGKLGHGKPGMSAGLKSTCNGHVGTKVLWQPSTKQPPTDARLGDLKGEQAAELAFQISLHAVLQICGSGPLRGVSCEKMVKLGVKLEKHCWTACGKGHDVLVACELLQENTSLCYIPPVAAHVAGRKLPATDGPAALILVPSHDRVMEVRQVWKPLKKLIQMSCLGLHTGTALERQVEGLRSQSAEVIVATPDRLYELVALDAVHIGSVSFLVLDALDEMLEQGFEDQLIRIEANVHSSRQILVLSKTFPSKVVRIIRLLMREPLTRVRSDKSMVLQSACVTQSATVVVNGSKRLEKFRKILEEVKTRHAQLNANPRIVVVVNQREKVQNVFAASAQVGFCVEDLTASKDQQDLTTLQVVKHFNQGQVQVLVLTEGMVSSFPFKSVEVGNVIFYEFPTSLSTYVLALTRMAKDSVCGRIYSICSGAMAPLAEQLVDVLQQCWQTVPPALEMLVKAVVTVTGEKKAISAI